MEIDTHIEVDRQRERVWERWRERQRGRERREIDSRGINR